MLLALALPACDEGISDPADAFAGLTVAPDTTRIQIGRAVRLAAVLPGGDTVPASQLTWRTDNPTVATVDASGRVSAVGLGRATVTAEAAGVAAGAEVEAGLAFLEVAAGRAHTCGLVPNGEIWCWGDGLDGQLGNGETAARPLPTRVSSPLAFMAVTAGFNHTCALAADRSAWCWGRGSLGQRGDGTANRTATAPVEVINGFEWLSLSAGVDHTCGVMADGRASCWGGNADGQLGTGGNGPRFGPFPIPGLTDIVQISAGLDHSCAVDDDGRAFCWGNNQLGQLGTDSTPTLPEPSPTAAVPQLTLRSIRAGHGYTCGVTTGGTAWCWGRGEDGQLGRDTTAAFDPLPAPLGVSTAFAALAPAVFHTCGAATDGTPWCWGTSRLGLPGATMSPVPLAVAGTGAVRGIAAGILHTCAVTDGWVAFCWGANQDGQLGDGGVTSSDTPVRVGLQP